MNTEDIPELQALIVNFDEHVDKIFKKYNQLTANEELRNFMLHYVAISIELKITPDDEVWKEKLKIIQHQIYRLLSQPKQQPKKGDIA